MGRIVSTSFDGFYRDMYPRLVRGLPRIVGDVYDTEDVAHDALLVVYEKWDRVSVCEEPATWTWRVALNIVAKRAKRRRHEQDKRQLRSDPEATMFEPHRDQVLWDAVLTLSLEQRTVVVLRHVDDLTFQQIAEIVRCSEPTARQRHRRAIQRLATLVPDVDRHG